MVEQPTAQIVDVAQPGAGGECAATGSRTGMLQEGDNLSLCAAIFCDGDQSRYRELYAVVFRLPSEKPNVHRRVFPVWRRWLAGILQNFQHAVQH